MTVFNSPIEIDAKCAREMAAKGSKLFWVLGSLDARRHAALQEISESVHSVDPEEMAELKSPEKLVGKAPILVCEHGITSLFLARQLREKGIEAFSVEGGVDGMFKW